MIILNLLEDNEDNAKAFFEAGAIDCILTLARDNPDDEMINVISMTLVAGTYACCCHYALHAAAACVKGRALGVRAWLITAVYISRWINRSA